MKRTLLVGFAAILMVASTTAINAQQRMTCETPKTEQCKKQCKQERVPQTPEQRATKLTARMTTQLSLSEAQAKKVYNANLNYINRMAELKSLRSERNLEILDILNDEQSVQFMEQLSKSKSSKGAKGAKRAQGCAPQRAHRTKGCASQCGCGCAQR